MNRMALGPQVASVFEAQQAFLEPRLRALGIGFQGFQLLACVHRFQGKATQTMVAGALGLSAGTLSEAVRSLVKLGLIEQRRSATDGRAKQLRLTSDGLRTAEEIRRIATQTERVMCAGLDERSVAVAASVLDRMRANLEQALQA
jgi:DNA-binding MarR family transcriptional regulator